MTRTGPDFAADLLRLFLCALSLLPAIVRAQDSPQAQAYADSGLAMARSQQFPQAEEELREAVHAAPSIARYRAQLGSILGLEGKWKESEANFEKAIELDSSNLAFRREAAAVEWQMGLVDRAETNLRYILKTNSSDAGATLLLGLVSDKRGDYKRAASLLMAQFDLAVSQPDRAVVLFHALVAAGQKHDLPSVIEVLRAHSNEQLWISAIGRCTAMAATADDVETAEALFTMIPENNHSGQEAAALPLAALRYRKGQITQAQELLSRLIQRGWVNADAQTLLGKCLEANHQFSPAAEAYSQAIEIEPSNVARYGDLISLELDSGRTQDALAWAKRALRIAPQNAGAWVLKGNAELRANAYKDSLTSYQQAARLDPSNPDAMLLIGGVDYIVGERDAAVAEYNSGIERFPRDARFYLNCAEVLLGSPDSTEVELRAKSLLEKAVKLAPRSAEAHYQLGQLALRQAQLENAEKELSASLDYERNRSKTHYALSVVYRRMGRVSDAQKQFAMYQELKRAEEAAGNGNLEAAKPAMSPQATQ